MPVRRHSWTSPSSDVATERRRMKRRPRHGVLSSSHCETAKKINSCDTRKENDVVVGSFRAACSDIDHPTKTNHIMAGQCPSGYCRPPDKNRWQIDLQPPAHKDLCSSV